MVETNKQEPASNAGSSCGTAGSAPGEQKAAKVGSADAAPGGERIPDIKKLLNELVTAFTGLPPKVLARISHELPADNVFNALVIEKAVAAQVPQQVAQQVGNAQQVAQQVAQQAQKEVQVKLLQAIKSVQAAINEGQIMTPNASVRENNVLIDAKKQLEKGMGLQQGGTDPVALAILAATAAVQAQQLIQKVLEPIRTNFKALPRTPAAIEPVVNEARRDIVDVVVLGCMATCTDNTSRDEFLGKATEIYERLLGRVPSRKEMSQLCQAQKILTQGPAKLGDGWLSNSSQATLRRGHGQPRLCKQQPQDPMYVQGAPQQFNNFNTAANFLVFVELENILVKSNGNRSAPVVEQYGEFQIVDVPKSYGGCVYVRPGAHEFVLWLLREPRFEFAILSRLQPAAAVRILHALLSLLPCGEWLITDNHDSHYLTDISKTFPRIYAFGRTESSTEEAMCRDIQNSVAIMSKLSDSDPPKFDEHEVLFISTHEDYRKLPKSVIPAHPWPEHADRFGFWPAREDLELFTTMDKLYARVVRGYLA